MKMKETDKREGGKEGGRKRVNEQPRFHPHGFDTSSLSTLDLLFFIISAKSLDMIILIIIDLIFHFSPFP